MGHIASQGEEANRRGIFTRVKCFPLYSLLLAINTTKVDLLSLDVEGAELQVEFQLWVGSASSVKMMQI